MTDTEELLARIARARSEVDEIERLVRTIGTKSEARLVADLIERAGAVEREVKKKEAAE
jgi:hypothetical protein